MRRIVLLAAILSPGVFHTGCTSQDPPRMNMDIPAAWSAPAEPGEDLTNWLAHFEDAQLAELVQESLRGNFNLLAARARLDRADALARIANADRRPQLAAEVFGSYRENSEVQRPNESYGVNLDASWEIDLWRRLHDATRAAEYAAEATRQDYLAARLSLAGQIAQAWFSIGERNLQRALAGKTLKNFQAALSIVEDRYRRGLAEPLDVRLIRTNVATAENNLARREGEKENAVRSVEALAGRYPGRKLDGPPRLPERLPPLPAGLPSSLLLRRPDILAAEQRYYRSAADLNVAGKRLFPRFNLNGQAGYRGETVSKVIDEDFTEFSGRVRHALYEGGRLRAGVLRAEAELDAAMAEYGEVILTAFEEVENALADAVFLDRQWAALQVAVREAVAADQLALENYGNGLVDIITVLEAQRRSFDTQSRLHEVVNQRLQNRIRLYLSLGGDFGEGPIEMPRLRIHPGIGP